jgi:hypothetical protein
LSVGFSVAVDDLASSHYYAGVTLALPQALAAEVGEADFVDVAFSVLAVNPSVTSEASMRYENQRFSPSLCACVGRI